MSELLVILVVAAGFAAFAVLSRRADAPGCHRADACDPSSDCGACDLAGEVPSDSESNHVHR